jgi:ribosomal protein S18 acetylase RimI-like enzyme
MDESTIRQVDMREVSAVERLFADARFVFQRAWLNDLAECSRAGLLFAAWERGHARGAMACVPQNPLAFTLCGAAFTDEEDMPRSLAPLLQLTLRRLEEAGASLLTYVGTEDWLVARLAAADFALEDQVITLLKTGWDVPESDEGEGIRIRPAEPTDLDDLTSLDARAFPAEWHYGRGVLNRALHSSQVFLVADDAGLIGYAYGDIQGGSAHLTRLAVAPEQQGRGAGAALLGETVRGFRRRGAWWITVNTQKSNILSQKLYQRFGFQSIGQSVPVLIRRLGR